MTQSPDVLVIGGGAAGAACARTLARGGRRVSLLAPAPHPGAAWTAAAGMLAPQIEARDDDEVYALGVAGREHVAHVAAELGEHGHDVGLRRDGILRLAQSEAAVAELRARVSWQRQLCHVCDWLDGEEVHARWPWLGPSFGALFAPREGAVDPVAWVRALQADAVAAGATIETHEARSLVREGDAIVGVRTDDGVRSAGAVVVAAGAWSAQLPGGPRPIAVAPVRGQMAAFPWPAGASPTIAYGDQGYVLWRNGEAIAGSTMEHAGFSPEVTPDGRGRVLANAVRILPALAGVDPLRTWAGLRPVTPDGLPILGRDPHVAGLWYALGGGRNGILFSAIMGELLRDLMDGQPLELEIAPFAPGRFWQW